ncbi:MAG: glycosyltransferase, partial [Dysgonamonadaceae bacterium]|nr:glycosyltransferase [Dysgonamonadaceae bacterium]
MIFVTGFGQMCNNILQFGHLYAWGKERGLPVIALRFCYKYPFFSINRAKHYNWFTYLFAKYGAKMHLIPQVSFLSEADVNEANRKKLSGKRFVLVKGWYLRDYEAFLRHRKELGELFAFQPSLREKMDRALPRPAEHTVRLGVHVRRGDYKRWMDGDFFFSDADFIRIIQSFLLLFENQPVEILIVSNEKSLSRTLYERSLPAPVYFPAGNPGEDLYA